MVSTFAIILRVLGGGHGEMNACSSSEELQSPGRILYAEKSHPCV